MYRAGWRDASWTMGVAFTSTIPHAGRLSQDGMNVTLEMHPRWASVRDTILFSLFSLMCLRFIPRYNIVRYCAGVLCNFRNVSKIEEDRPAVGCSGNVVSLKWAARQFLGKCIPQVYRKNGKTAGLKCACESASAHTGGTMEQFCNIL